MSRWRKKPVVIEAMTFDEMVARGLAQEGANIVDGVPWSFTISGWGITHEDDKRYIINTLEGQHDMTPKDMLIIGIQGEIYPCKIDIFHATYDSVTSGD